ncbi:MAG: T9SS type A sorting domain-containing protein [Bacteroidia bacterium]|nr:T9SS type A sorting domain-containing protein [Bacteroidia bacterium]
MPKPSYFFPALVFCLLCVRAAAQPVWTYEPIALDVQESGAQPDLVRDASGDLHVTYWNRAEDRLLYARRNHLNGLWTLEDIPDVGTFGYKSALALDVAGFVHIAYLANTGGASALHYATNLGGGWTIEEVNPGTTIGVYGPDNVYPTYIQASLDLFFQDNGQPGIVYFNGAVNNISVCNTIDSIYTNYELNMNLALRQSPSGWTQYKFDDRDYKGAFNCLIGPDRVGEFCQMLPQYGNRRRLVANSLHNHELLLATSAPGSLTDWTYTVVDSSFRLFANAGNNSYFREGFASIEPYQHSDSVLHLGYTLVNFYSNGTQFGLRQLLLYARVKPDSLGQPGYRPYYYTFPQVSRNRKHVALTGISDTQLFMGYYSANEGTVVVASTTNAGLTWTQDTLYEVLTNAPLKLEVNGDSLVLLVYDAGDDVLRMSSRSLSQPGWRHTRVTRSEFRGGSLGSAVRRVTGDDLIYLAFTEASDDQLYYRERIGGIWNETTLDVPGKATDHVSLDVDALGSPWVAYVHKATNTLRVARRINGVWSLESIDTQSAARDVVLKIQGNTTHVAYYDLISGSLKYAIHTGNGWSLETADASGSFTGQRPDMVVSPDGTVHISYLDALNTRLLYATRSPAGTWTRTPVTDNFAFTPTYSAIQADNGGTPGIVFRHANENKLYFATPGTTGTFETEEVIGDIASLIGIPVRMVYDTFDNPWVLYNYSSALDELRLVRRGLNQVWHPVALTNPDGIANEYDFHRAGNDLYIIGRNTRIGATGLGMLTARNGVLTDISGDLAEAGLTLYPNPGKSAAYLRLEMDRSASFSLDVYNLLGARVHHEAVTALSAGVHTFSWEGEHLPPGVYICRVNVSGIPYTLRWVREP